VSENFSPELTVFIVKKRAGGTIPAMIIKNQIERVKNSGKVIIHSAYHNNYETKTQKSQNELK